MTNINNAAYTVSDMLNSINTTMGPLGASVELKRNIGNGVMKDTTETEVSALDAKARIKAASVSISHLSRDEKLAWVLQKKMEGNTLYKNHEFTKACEVYVQALVGLDFGSSSFEKKEVQQSYQIPITCNLAASLIALRDWNKVVSVCTQALIIDPTCVTALRRRGQAFTQLLRFDAATKDFENALKFSENDDTAGIIKSKVVELEKAKSRHVKDSCKRRKRDSVTMQRAVGTLYSDKTLDKSPPRPSPSLMQRFLNTILDCFSNSKKES